LLRNLRSAMQIGNPAPHPPPSPRPVGVVLPRTIDAQVVCTTRPRNVCKLRVFVTFKNNTLRGIVCPCFGCGSAAPCFLRSLGYGFSVVCIAFRLHSGL
jgi:hypothetical protein